MTAIPLHFELPANLTAKKFLTKLSKKIDVQIATQQYTIKTFYDSFDWRLYKADIICEFNHSQSVSHLRLINRNNGELIAQQNMPNVPKFSGQLCQCRLKSYLAPLLEMRALLPLCQLPLVIYRINILNKDQKIVLRLQLDEYEQSNNRLTLHPLKGYEKALIKVSRLLQNDLQLKPAHCTILSSELKQQGRKPKDYSSKLFIKLKPDMRADKASKMIYQHLLHIMRANEAGTIADTDSEFLHDFRIAVRRTRAALSQIKNTLPTSVTARYAAFFAWLGQITGETRDMDVYLLNYGQYKSALPLSLQEDIAPLYDFLKQKQSQAQKELAAKLNSSEYKKQLAAWEQYLKDPLPKKAQGSHANMSIKELADQRIWKVYKRLLKEAQAISDASPAEALHDLRKTCKKLRYLMEFFQCLYPEDAMKSLLKALKGFQSVLGDFQDYEIQEIKLRQFSEEMMSHDVSSNTILAMGVLVLHLDSLRCAARNDFAEQFNLFQQPGNRAAFKNLFAHKAQVKN